MNEAECIYERGGRGNRRKFKRWRKRWSKGVERKREKSQVEL